MSARAQLRVLGYEPGLSSWWCAVQKVMQRLGLTPEEVEPLLQELDDDAYAKSREAPRA